MFNKKDISRKKNIMIYRITLEGLNFMDDLKIFACNILKVIIWGSGLNLICISNNLTKKNTSSLPQVKVNVRKRLNKLFHRRI